MSKPVPQTSAFDDLMRRVLRVKPEASKPPAKKIKKASEKKREGE